MFIWRSVSEIIQKEGLDKKLIPGDDGMTYGPDSVSWANIAPRTRKNLNLAITNAGVILSASLTNAAVIDQMYELFKERIKEHPNLVMTEIRHWVTGHANFSIKPCMEIRKDGFEGKVKALVEAFELVVEVLQPFI